MPEQAEATVEITAEPDVDETRLPLLINRLENDPSVADVEWVDRPTVDGEEVDDGE